GADATVTAAARIATTRIAAAGIATAGVTTAGVTTAGIAAAAVAAPDGVAAAVVLPAAGAIAAVRLTSRPPRTRVVPALVGGTVTGPLDDLRAGRVAAARHSHALTRGEVDER